MHKIPQHYPILKLLNLAQETQSFYLGPLPLSVTRIQSVHIKRFSKKTDNIFASIVCIIIFLMMLLNADLYLRVCGMISINY
jgi:hypothetical protein